MGPQTVVQSQRKDGSKMDLFKGKRVVFVKGSPDDGVPPRSRGTVSSISIEDDITIYVSPDARPAIRLGYIDYEAADELAEVPETVSSGSPMAFDDDLVCLPAG